MVICRAAVPDKEREASAELADDFGMDEQMSPLAGRQNIEFTNRQLVSLILPMLAEQLLGITVGLADSLMVATVGDASISAVSLVDSVSALMIYIFSAMATGGAVVAGQYLGRREREEACRSAQQLMVLLGVVSLAVTALLYLFRDLIVTRLFGHIDADVMEATNIYYSYVMASIPGIALYNGGAALFRTMSRSGVSLKVSLLMNGINVAGNAILIFGLGFDVAGVAIPTLVSRTVAAVVIVAGVAFGGETGFLVGAMTMLVSNMLFSQGPWTPWQMFAMGIIGWLAGVLYRKGVLRRGRLSLCIFGVICSTIVYGGIMNPASALMWSNTINWKIILSYYVTGLPVDLVRAIATFFFLWLGAEPMLEKLDRVKVKYGLAE